MQNAQRQPQTPPSECTREEADPRRDAADPLICGVCNYDLRHTTTHICPECGAAFDPNHLIDKLIPWEQRRYIGFTRAYLRTVWLVSCHPTRMAAFVDYRMSLRAARFFRVIVWLLAVASLVMTAASLSEGTVSRRLSDSSATLGAAYVGVGLGLLGAMCVSEWAF